MFSFIFLALFSVEMPIQDVPVEGEHNNVIQSTALDNGVSFYYDLRRLTNDDPAHPTAPCLVPNLNTLVNHNATVAHYRNLHAKIQKIQRVLEAFQEYLNGDYGTYDENPGQDTFQRNAFRSRLRQEDVFSENNSNDFLNSFIEDYALALNQCNLVDPENEVTDFVIKPKIIKNVVEQFIVNDDVTRILNHRTVANFNAFKDFITQVKHVDGITINYIGDFLVRKIASPFEGFIEHPNTSPIHGINNIDLVRAYNSIFYPLSQAYSHYLMSSRSPVIEDETKHNPNVPSFIPIKHFEKKEVQSLILDQFINSFMLSLGIQENRKATLLAKMINKLNSLFPQPENFTQERVDDFKNDIINSTNDEDKKVQVTQTLNNLTECLRNTATEYSNIFRHYQARDLYNPTEVVEMPNPNKYYQHHFGMNAFDFITKCYKFMMESGNTTFGMQLVFCIQGLMDRGNGLNGEQIDRLNNMKTQLLERLIPAPAPAPVPAAN